MEDRGHSKGAPPTKQRKWANHEEEEDGGSSHTHLLDAASAHVRIQMHPGNL